MSEILILRSLLLSDCVESIDKILYHNARSFRVIESMLKVTRKYRSWIYVPDMNTVRFIDQILEAMVKVADRQTDRQSVP